MRTQKEIFEKIFGSVNGEPVSFMSLCRQCGFNYRTVRRCLELVEYIQADENRLKIERDGFRVIIKRPERSIYSSRP